MASSACDELDEGHTVGGRPIYLYETNAENWIRSSLMGVQLRLIQLIEAPGKRGAVLPLAKVLKANFSNPVHYGDNKPGTWFASGMATTSDPEFTFWDLYQYGITGEDGFDGFTRDCGLPNATTHLSVVAVIGLLLIDSATVAMEAKRLSWAGHLMSQAQDCAEIALLIKLSETKQSEIHAATREALSARGVSAMKARYAKDKDGKQAAKKWVYECWRDWQAKPEKYKNASTFARDMLDKQPDRLTTEIVITRWVRTWKKEEMAP